MKTIITQSSRDEQWKCSMKMKISIDQKGDPTK